MTQRRAPHRTVALAAIAALASGTAPLWAGASSPAPAAAAGPQTDEVGAIIDEEIAGLGEADAAALWERATRLAGLIGDEYGADFDAAVESRLRAKPADPRAALFLATLRLEGDAPDEAVIARAVAPVAGADDANLAWAAAELLGRIALDISDRDLKKGLAKDLLKTAERASAPVSLRVSTAIAAYSLGNGGQIAAARRVLYDFLDSSDPNLRAAGALGFAQIGTIEEVDGVEDELDRLARLPGEEGKLARAYMDQLRQTRFYDTRLRNLQKQGGGGRRVGSTLPPEFARLERLIDLIQDAHLDGGDVSRDELIESAMQGMLERLDRHSSYFSSDAYAKFEQGMEGEYGGIGAYVQNDPDDNLFTITRPIYSGPAYNVGLTTDDKIVRIDDWPTIGETTDDIIKRLKGKPGTTVRLYIWRSDMDPVLIERPTEDMVVEVVRAQISVPSVHSELLPGDIGLVELQRFGRGAGNDVRDAILELQGQAEGGALTGVILDLRNNTGGYLTQAQAVADLFLPKGKVIVKTESRVIEKQVLRSERDPIVPMDTPVAVLINRFSASASEIVSGALQDHGRAKLVGVRSFGKGSVQRVIPMPGELEDAYADENRNGRRDNWERITKDHDGDGEFDYAPRVKLTIERYRLPLGRSIHRELDAEGNVESPGGVPADLEIRSLRREPWRLREMRRIQQTRVLRTWVAEAYAKDPELLKGLAYCDFDDPDRYPGFDELYESLDTTLSRDDVRFLVRIDVRRRVQDVRGHAFPYGDFVEDLQLQGAIETILEGSGRSVEQIVEYARSFDERPEGEDEALAAAPAGRSGERADLERAMALIAEAEQGPLGKESAEELRAILKRERDGETPR